MALLPKIKTDLTKIKTRKYVDDTYLLDLENKSIGRKIDDKEAILQAIKKILSTERYAHAIYSGNYGIELNALIGKDINFVKSDLERRIKEALLIDDRILGINEFEIIQKEGDTLECSFIVNTILGSIPVTTDIINI